MKVVKYIFMLVLVLCLAGCAEEPSVTAEDKPCGYGYSDRPSFYER